MLLHNPIPRLNFTHSPILPPFLTTPQSAHLDQGFAPCLLSRVSLLSDPISLLRSARLSVLHLVLESRLANLLAHWHFFGLLLMRCVRRPRSQQPKHAPLA